MTSETEGPFQSGPRLLLRPVYESSSACMFSVLVRGQLLQAHLPLEVLF